jgi:hypothetical protein
VLNRSDIAAPLGMSVPGIGRWLDVLEATAQVLVVPPWFENVGKRLLKTPKVYVADSGLACHLLGIRTAGELARSPFRGALFEGLVAAEVAKSQENAGLRREVYFFRDREGLEVDFVAPGPGGRTRLIEAKASATVKPEMAAPLRRLADSFVARFPERGEPEMYVVHEHSPTAPATRAVAPGVVALPWRDFVSDILPLRSSKTSAGTTARRPRRTRTRSPAST